jgi:hypothetical protein
MRGPATRLEHNNGRPPLRLNAVDWAIYAIVAACVLGAWAFTCSSTPDMQQCMRDGAPGLLGILLQAVILVLAVWTGSEVGRRQRSTSLGLAGGTAVFLALTGLLAWFGLGLRI